ncbi:predicted protein [Naegleria gruberi]|uniref:Predicted protein n=1 Tax=Naegleria gruberi TaxID=5762 RepID=D2VMB0_NAEGR|nr:uncharacterized protein NAEGRDRAFT_70071 [Naegleria gruberi]EFC42031.1 predicted protein [Naegleria gruberi]|eukprot:XP_002674775.1 predicted protein [Naegleria gruberi strain NEG-M]
MSQRHKSILYGLCLFCSILLVFQFSSVIGFSPRFNNSIIDMHSPKRFYSKHFHNCTNTSPIMLYSIFNSYLPQQKYIFSDIPDDFYCDNVTLWNDYSVDAHFHKYNNSIMYSMFHTSSKPSEWYDICGRVRKWENILGRDCASFLCDYNETYYLPEYLKQVTNQETTIFDWMNYCVYCKPGNKTYDCNPRDFYTQVMVYNFPTSALYCGSVEFGIPFVVNKSIVSPILNQSFHFNAAGLDFNYICYCVDGNQGYFSFKCNGNRYNYWIDLIIRYFVIVSHTLSIPLMIFLVIIPKFIDFRRRKSLYIVCPCLGALISELILTIELYLAQLYGPGNYRMIMDYSSFSFALIGLFSWIFNWLRLIGKMVNQKYGVVINWVHLGISIFILISAISVIIAHLYTDYQYTFAIVYALLAFFIGLFFLTFGIVGFRLLKKVSDVNLLNSSIVYYLIFIISVHFLIPISSVLDFSFMMRSMAIAFRYYFILIVNVSVLFMDSRREEIKDMYMKCFGKAERIRKQSLTSASAALKENLLSDNLNETELNTSSYYDSVEK